MTDQPVTEIIITEKTYPIGSILERPGKIAKVRGISWNDRVKPKTFKGYHCAFTTIATDGTVLESQGLLRANDLNVPPERGGWKLKKVEAAVPVITTNGDIFHAEPVTPAPIPSGELVQTLPMAAALLIEKAEIARMDAEAAASVALDGDTQSDPAQDKIAALESDLQAISGIAAARLVELNAISAALNGMMELTASDLPGRVAALKEAYFKASKRNDELADENASLVEQLHEAGKAFETANARIDELTFAPIVEKLEAADLTAERCKKFEIIRKATVADLSRMEHDGWLTEHYQFSDDGLDLNIVYSRYTSATAPRKSVTAVGDHFVFMTPIADPETLIDSERLGKAERIEARMQAAYAEANAAAFEEATRRIDELQPLRDVLNRFPVLSLTSRVARPEVQS